MITNGAQIAIYSGDKLKLVEDFQIAKPTVFISVPRLYNKIYGKIIGTVNNKGGLTKKLFNSALETKLKNLKENGCIGHSFYDNIVFKKVRK